MSGIPQFNFPMFDAVAKSLRKQGYTIISPAELDDPSTREAALASPDGAPGTGAANGESYGDFLARDLKLILDEAEGVAALLGWKRSVGASIEVYAAARQGKTIYTVHPTATEGHYTLRDYEPFLGSGKEGILAHTPDATTTETLTPELLENTFKSISGREVRITSDTGGQKGRKPERLDLIPPDALFELARVYGMGAEKYDDHNYLKGYNWSLSYASLLRHATQWANGEDRDDESGLHHLAHAAWHCFALMMFQRHALGTDDRIPVVTGIGKGQGCSPPSSTDSQDGSD
jgi:hypothetical protein